MDDEAYRLEVITPGVATGQLAGGNLSLLAAMTGTGYEWKVKGKLLFIEDVGEQPYRIDRMLTQLCQAYPIQEAAGIVLGIFEDCKARNPEYSLTLSECLKDQLGDLGIPVLLWIFFWSYFQSMYFPCWT